MHIGCVRSLENFYNILNVDEPDYSNMKQFIEDSLDSARQNGEKVHCQYCVEIFQTGLKVLEE